MITHARTHAAPPHHYYDYVLGYEHKNCICKLCIRYVDKVLITLYVTRKHILCIVNNYFII